MTLQLLSRYVTTPKWQNPNAQSTLTSLIVLVTQGIKQNAFDPRMSTIDDIFLVVFLTMFAKLLRDIDMPGNRKYL